LYTLVYLAKLMWNSNKISEMRGECVELTYMAKGLRSIWHNLITRFKNSTFIQYHYQSAACPISW